MQTIIKFCFKRLGIRWIEIALINQGNILIEDDRIWINGDLFNQQYIEHWLWIKQAYGNTENIPKNCNAINYLPF